MNLKKIVALLLLVIPLGIYSDVWLYNSTEPSLGGLPFYYWFQTLMLLVTGIMFYFAAYLIDKKQ
ncbi:MAG: DUF3311 domain-containing protein [Candidatus Micrarchaeia archaeon]